MTCHLFEKSTDSVFEIEVAKCSEMEVAIEVFKIVHSDLDDMPEEMQAKRMIEIESIQYGFE